jgi:YidC/Oxa1 family membrane protein insertase
MLAQIPVFLGLYHVLRSFNRTTGGFGQPHMSVIENRMTGNYVFTPADVGHFLDANLWGAPIGAYMTQRAGLDAFTHFSRPAVIAVGAPVMILAGIATYFNSRASVARQSPEAAANPQTAMMNKLALYVFPLGVVVGGPFLPLAIILYWFSNNIWTFGQQHYVFGKIEKEDEAKKQEVIRRRAANAPAPGAKPKRNPKTAPQSGNGSSTDSDEGAESGSAKTGSDGSDGHVTEAKTGKAQPEKPSTAGRNNSPSNRTPRPGARPKRRKR